MKPCRVAQHNEHLSILALCRKGSSASGAVLAARLEDEGAHDRARLRCRLICVE